MGDHKNTQAILGKDLTVMMGYEATAREDFKEVFEVIELTPFSPTRAAIDVTYYNSSMYRDIIQGLYDNAEVTLRGNYAISDHRSTSPDDKRIVFAKLWDWFQDDEDTYTEPLDILIQYPRYKPTDLFGFHLFQGHITTLELDPPLDAQLTYTCTLTTSGPIKWATSDSPPGVLLKDKWSEQGKGKAIKAVKKNDIAVARPIVPNSN